VLLVNGLPLVLIEAKTPVKKCISWVDGAVQVHDDYEKFVPELFVCNVFSVATEGKELTTTAPIGLPVKDWGPWHLDDGRCAAPPAEVAQGSAESMLRPHVVLDILGSFTLFATDKKKRRIKIICRYQQYEAANKIVERVLAGHPRKGLIWHFQGSGKSLLMVFAAQKLRMHAGLKNPTVLIVVDRIDLDSQITGTFTASDIPNLVKADSRRSCSSCWRRTCARSSSRRSSSSARPSGVLNDRSNIIALVDEAHRTQEGDLGRKMREALPNAFLFGLTGTPINRADRNTFYAFGADEDEKGYMSRYGFEESIRDGATLKLHFEPRLIDLHIDKAALDAAYKDADRRPVGPGQGQPRQDRRQDGRAGEDARAHPQGLRGHRRALPDQGGAQRLQGPGRHLRPESCLLYKAELDKLLPPEATTS
jgi:type I restriction enzyme R subunit